MGNQEQKHKTSGYIVEFKDKRCIEPNRKANGKASNKISSRTKGESGNSTNHNHSTECSNVALVFIVNSNQNLEAHIYCRSSLDLSPAMCRHKMSRHSKTGLVLQN